MQFVPIRARAVVALALLAVLVLVGVHLHHPLSPPESGALMPGTGEAYELADSAAQLSPKEQRVMRTSPYSPYQTSKDREKATQVKALSPCGQGAGEST